jgi:hypothetical protein
LVVCAFFGSLFMILGYVPRTTSRLWLDVNDGRQIVQAVGIPASDAALPLSEGMPVVFNSWLSNLLAVQTESWAGIDAVPQLFAAAVWIYLLVLACVFYAQSPRWQVMLIATALVLLLDAPGRVACGPHAWGAICLAVLLAILTYYRAPGFAPRRAEDGCARENRTRWRVYVAVGLLFALWANLHFSFLVGLAVLAAVTAGRCYQVAVRTRSFRRPLADRRFRQWLLLTELAAVAVLVNPYGIGVYYEAVRVLSHTKLQTTPVWEALNLRTWSGVMLVVTAAMLIVAFRYSRRRVHPVHVVLLVLATAGILASGFGVRWFAPIAAFILARHLYDALPATAGNRVEAWASRLIARMKGKVQAALETAGLPPAAEVNSKLKKGPFTFVFTLLSGITLWTTFVYSPIGHAFLGGGEKLEAADVEMPLAAGDYLRRNADSRLIYAPVEWSDWLTWHAGPETRVLMNSNFQRVPQCVIDDHKFVATGGPSWQRPLDNYQVTLLVVDKENQSTLAEEARDSAAWEVVFEDQEALIARRVPGVKATS